MKKASRSAIVITNVFYLLCGSFVYAAFGNNTSGKLLTGFGFYEPYWLVDLANACVIIHLVGGYQLKHGFLRPDSDFVNGSRQLKLPLLTTFQLNPFRLCFRTLYVVSTTRIAMLFPYFNQVLGVLGALKFWPLVVYFPVEMYFVQRKIAPWSRKWVALKTFSFACFLESAVAFKDL
ncbi:probable amino acid permease 7 [Tanacetum coccineum]